ncbi:hypothetical protein ACFV42_40870 [Streptomyces solisilvae]|uniref:hypothetical protein n=1 Tax=Streptomyces malaysiensis TaxID=92644 RepID=UPI0036BB60C6
MTELLNKVLEAHGGIERYNQVSTIEVDITYGGPFWEFKGQADFVGEEHTVANLHSEKIRQVNSVTGRVVEYDKSADVVTVTAADGAVIGQLNNPRATFEGYATDTKWTPAQMAYFRSYATWHYLPEPFLFAWEGAKVEEVDAWVENGESWRGLDVTFSDNVDAHNDTQRYFFDDKGLLRRMDYQPVVNGYSPTAHYVSGHTTVDGFIVPTRRDILSRQDDRTPDRSWTPITLDLRNISIK